MQLQGSLQVKGFACEIHLCLDHCIKVTPVIKAHAAKKTGETYNRTNINHLMSGSFRFIHIAPVSTSQIWMALQGYTQIEGIYSCRTAWSYVRTSPKTPQFSTPWPLSAGTQKKNNRCKCWKCHWGTIFKSIKALSMTPGCWIFTATSLKLPPGAGECKISKSGIKISESSHEKWGKTSLLNCN